MPRHYLEDCEKPRKPKSTRKSPRISRSTKLRKYASVYKSYVRKSEQSKINKSPRRSRRNKESGTDTHTRRKTRDKKKTRKPRKKHTSTHRRKSLNPYQKFVQSESKKEKYKSLPGKQRLSAIAKEWKKLSR